MSHINRVQSCGLSYYPRVRRRWPLTLGWGKEEACDRVCRCAATLAASSSEATGDNVTRRRRLRPRSDQAGADGCRRLRPHVCAHRQGFVQAAVPVARIHPAELVPVPGVLPAHPRGLRPLTVLLIFLLNILLAEFGAADVSGAGAAIGAVTQLGPLVTVLVVAGAGSTAICADLGARTIREEIDALEVLGIDPIHRLVVPRVVASTFVALLLNGAVITVGLVGGFIFGVYLQNVSAGAYVSTLTLITGLPEVVISIVKAGTFGLIAGLVGCYRGLTVAGGAKGVGTAVNETLVLCVVALFAVNVVLTTIGVRFGTGH